MPKFILTHDIGVGDEEAEIITAANMKQAQQQAEARFHAKCVDEFDFAAEDYTPQRAQELGLEEGDEDEDGLEGEDEEDVEGDE